MRLHAALGDAEGIARALRTLTRRLAEVDVPAPAPAPADSQRLATELARQLLSRQRAAT